MSNPSPQIDVVGVGLNATDTLVRLPQHPVAGSKVESSSVTVLPGGQVATAMVACCRWGLRTRYVGKLGDDPAAAVHIQEFQKAGVDARIVTVPGCTSQQAIILVDAQGERTVLWQRDGRMALLPADLRREEWIVNARALLVDGYDTEAAIAAAEWAREAGIPVIADLDDVYTGVAALLEKIDYLIVSRDFPQRISGERSLQRSLPALQKQFGCRVTAATLGTGGVLAWDGNRFIYAQAYRVPVVDTTGAGDIFHAAFIYGLLQGWPLEQQLRFSCAAAALNCTGLGARGGIHPLARIEELMDNSDCYPAAEEASAAH